MIDTVKLRGLLERLEGHARTMDLADTPGWATANREAATAIEALLDTLDAMQGSIERVRGVIDFGYVGLDQCEHGKYGYEDCMSCYDTALLAALEMPSDPTIRHRGRG